MHDARLTCFAAVGRPCGEFYVSLADLRLPRFRCAPPPRVQPVHDLHFDGAREACGAGSANCPAHPVGLAFYSDGVPCFLTHAQLDRRCSMSIISVTRKGVPRDMFISGRAVGAVGHVM